MRANLQNFLNDFHSLSVLFETRVCFDYFLDDVSLATSAAANKMQLTDSVAPSLSLQQPLKDAARTAEDEDKRSFTSSPLNKPATGRI